MCVCGFMYLFILLFVFVLYILQHTYIYIYIYVCVHTALHRYTEPYGLETKPSPLQRPLSPNLPGAASLVAAA